MKKRPDFFEGAGLALIVSIVGAVGFFGLSTLFGSTGIFRLTIAVLSLIYILYILSRSHERVGRVTVVTGWLFIAGINWIFAPSLLLYLVIHLIMIWLIRSLYFYSSLLSSLADFCLTGFSLAAAVWAWSMSQSLLLSFWCFFLVQALFSLIPSQIKNNKSKATTNAHPQDSFERAHQLAEKTLRKMTTL